MKKIMIFVIAFCLLLTGGVLPAFAEDSTTEESVSDVYVPQKTMEELSSRYIPEDVATAIGVQMEYEHLIKVYALGMYYHDLNGGKSLQQLLENPLSEWYFVINEEALAEGALPVFFQENGEWKLGKKYSLSRRQQMYHWLPNLANVQTLVLNEKELPIENIYFIMTSSPPRTSMIVYDVGDVNYYAVYENGVEEAPLYFSETTFYEYIHAWVAEWNSISESVGGEVTGIGSSLTIDISSFETLSVTLSDKPANSKSSSPSWLLPVLIGGGVMILFGCGVGVGVAVAKSRKKKKTV